MKRELLELIFKGIIFLTVLWIIIPDREEDERE